MKTGLLSLLVAFGFTGQVLAQGSEAPRRAVQEPAAQLATRADESSAPSQAARQPDSKNPVLRAASLKERERLRKGLPRWWN